MTRVCVLAFAALAGCGAHPTSGVAPPSRARSPEATQDRANAARRTNDAWLHDEVVALTRADPETDDAEFAAIGDAIGDARIVGLGESSHGAGSTFAAKARLIEYLHRVKGFDVVVWESPMYGMMVANDAIANGEPAAAAMRKAMFPLWSVMKEVRPLLDYAQASHGGPRPLQIVGFDPQVMGGRAVTSLMNALRAATASITPRAQRIKARQHIKAVATGYAKIAAVEDVVLSKMGTLNPEELKAWQTDYLKTHGLVEEDALRLEQAADQLSALLSDHDAELAAARGSTAILRQAIVDLAVQGRITYLRYGRPGADEHGRLLEQDGWNLRDARSAANVEWLANVIFPGKKLVLWAHSGHLLSGYYEAGWEGLSHEPVADGLTPMGALLRQRFGDQLYVIAFTAYAGSHQLFGGPLVTIEPRPAHSLEQRIHDLGHPYAFVDFRHTRGQPGHPLQKRVTLSVRGYELETMTWPAIIDGLFVIDNMRPATPRD